MVAIVYIALHTHSTAGFDINGVWLCVCKFFTHSFNRFFSRLLRQLNWTYNGFLNAKHIRIFALSIDFPTRRLCVCLVKQWRWWLRGISCFSFYFNGQFFWNRRDVDGSALLKRYLITERDAECAFHRTHIRFFFHMGTVKVESHSLLSSSRSLRTSRE